MGHEGIAQWPSGNRSVAVVISHLVLDQAMDFWEALETVAAARGRVLGSGSFPLQLLRLLLPQPLNVRNGAWQRLLHTFNPET